MPGPMVIQQILTVQTSNESMTLSTPSSKLLDREGLSIPYLASFSSQTSKLESYGSSCCYSMDGRAREGIHLESKWSLIAQQNKDIHCVSALPRLW